MIAFARIRPVPQCLEPKPKRAQWPASMRLKARGAARLGAVRPGAGLEGRNGLIGQYDPSQRKRAGDFHPHQRDLEKPGSPGFSRFGALRPRRHRIATPAVRRPSAARVRRASAAPTLGTAPTRHTAPTSRGASKTRADLARARGSQRARSSALVGALALEHRARPRPKAPTNPRFSVPSMVPSTAISSVRRRFSSAHMTLHNFFFSLF